MVKEGRRKKRDGMKEISFHRANSALSHLVVVALFVVVVFFFWLVVRAMYRHSMLLHEPSLLESEV